MERVTIIGLGLIGTSLGLALRQTKTLRAEIVGHDAEPAHAARAQRRGAVAKTSYNLLDAVDGARLVILAVRSWPFERRWSSSLRTWRRVAW